MYLMSGDILGAIEYQTIKVEQLAKVALVVEEAMRHSPVDAKEYTLAVTNLTNQLGDVFRALDEIIKQQINIGEIKECV